MDLATLALWCTILGLPVATVATWLAWRSSSRGKKNIHRHREVDVPRIIKSVMNGKVVDVPWETDLDVVHMWEQHNGVNQQWFMRKVSNGNFSVISRLTGKCLEIEDHLAVDGARVRQANFAGTPNQQWIVTRLDGGKYRIHNRHSGKCLDVLGWNHENKAAIGQWQCHRGANQAWCIEPPL